MRKNVNGSKGNVFIIEETAETAARSDRVLAGGEVLSENAGDASVVECRQNSLVSPTIPRLLNRNFPSADNRTA